MRKRKRKRKDAERPMLRSPNGLGICPNLSPQPREREGGHRKSEYDSHRFSAGKRNTKGKVCRMRGTDRLTGISRDEHNSGEQTAVKAD